MCPKEFWLYPQIRRLYSFVSLPPDSDVSMHICKIAYTNSQRQCVNTHLNSVPGRLRHCREEEYIRGKKSNAAISLSFNLHCKAIAALFFIPFLRTLLRFCGSVLKLGAGPIYPPHVLFFSFFGLQRYFFFGT